MRNVRGCQRIGPVLVVLAAVAALAASCSGSGRRAAAPGSSVPATTAIATTTVPDPTTEPATTTTTVPVTSTTDPGALPQTSQLPSADDPQFTARMSDLLRAVYTGNTALAGPAFFPLTAYIQVKGITDPVHDYETRLIPDYDQDILELHADLGPEADPPVLDHVYVPAAAAWILPGEEYNKGSYWRVYDSRVYFRTGGQLHYFSVASLISWRGQWYVVHLGSIR